jgi:dipeptidyl aminopeptidase/acylaminoacyl peptidase
MVTHSPAAGSKRLVAGVAALLVWTVAACQATVPGPTGVDPSPTGSPSLVATPSTTPSPTPTARSITGRIAYVHNSGKLGSVSTTDIWLIGPTGRNPVQLTNDPENESSPFWLLDGSRLVFAIFDYAKNPYYGRLVSMLPDGSGRRDLAPVANYGDGILSPDGRYAAWGGGGAIDGRDGITLLDRSTGEAKLLTTQGEGDPIWSPDGRALLAREPLLGAVVVAEVPSGRVTRFSKPDIESLLGWTADGQSIVFVGPESLTTPTWMAPRAGGPVVAMPPNTELASPTWTSPDGRSILERGAKGYAFALRSGSGGDAAGLAQGLTTLGGSPTWASNSAAFAVAAARLDEVGEDKSAIYVVGLDSRTLTQITTGPLDASPAWEPTP